MVLTFNGGQCSVLRVCLYIKGSQTVISVVVVLNTPADWETEPPWFEAPPLHALIGRPGRRERAPPFVVRRLGR